VVQNRVDHVALGTERADPHRGAAGGTAERIDSKSCRGNAAQRRRASRSGSGTGLKSRVGPSEHRVGVCALEEPVTVAAKRPMLFFSVPPPGGASSSRAGIEVTTARHAHGAA
jgi:hypothetical protein